MAWFRRTKSTKAAPADVTTGPNWPNHDSDLWTHDYARLYRRQPAVRAVVDFLADNQAQLNPKVYLRRDDNDRVELHDHPLAVLLRNPNSSTTRYRLFRDTNADKFIHGRAYWLLDRTLFPTTITRIPISKISRTQDADGRMHYSRAWDGTPIDRNLLVVFSGYSPEADWRDEDGVSPLETLRNTLAEEYAAVMHRRGFWRNAARREGLIERPAEAPEWSDPARARFRTDWENTSAGVANAGRTPILEDGMHWVGDSFSPHEADYIEGRRLHFEEVCRQYRVAPKLFGVGDTQNANVDSFHTQLYQDTLGPINTEYETDIILQLLPKVEPASNLNDNTYLEFSIAEKMQGSFEVQARALTTSVGVPVMGVNEGRAILNLPRINDPAFDTPIQPLNVMYGGQPAPTIPTEVPAPGKARTKARGEIPAAVLRRRNEAAAAHTELFRRHFAAIEKSMNAKAAGFDMSRFDAKLTGQLYDARIRLAQATGQRAARQLKGVYDPAQTDHWMIDSANAQARSVNQALADDLAIADDPAAVFAIAKSSRAERLGLSTATEVINFARHEAARQSTFSDGRTRQKTWVVTSDNSRHPELDGETVNFDDTFSNGLQWPGDITGDVGEIAGCACLLDLS